MNEPQSRIESWLICAALFAVLLACKKKDELDPDRPLPSVQVPVTAAPSPVTPPAPAEPERAKPSTPTPAARPKSPSTPTETATDEGATAAQDAGSRPESEPTATGSDAAATPAPSQAGQCIDKCQAVLSKCLTAPREGGLPGFGNTRECAEAFDSCRVACTIR